MVPLALNCNSCARHALFPVTRFGGPSCLRSQPSWKPSLASRRVSRRSQRFDAIAMASATDLPPVMVNACTGKMGHSTAEAVVRAGLKLVPYSFTGESEAVAVGNVGVSGIPVALVGPVERQLAMDRIKKEYPNLIIIDFTVPMSVNDNGRFYCHNNLPFVMGTTGGDRELLSKETEASGVYAVIAPQMGKQVVAFQAMMETMANTFPGSFSGYKLTVTESHQSGKADTSGTAKAVVSSFQKLGVSFQESEIKKVRDPMTQIDKMGVPSNALGGHAFHTYHLTSPDGSVNFEFQHNVCGRQIYAEGTVDAVLFLARQIAAGAPKKLYNMIDVLQAGAMR